MEMGRAVGRGPAFQSGLVGRDGGEVGVPEEALHFFALFNARAATTASL